MRIEVDWRSSGLSALPLMCRTALIAVALAVLLPHGALTAQTNRSTRTVHKHAAASTARTGRQFLQNSAAARPMRVRATNSANLSGMGRRLTPDEAGRKAGMRILRGRADMPTTMRRPVHVMRRRSMRRPRLERTAWRSQGSGAMRISEANNAVQEDAESDGSGSGEPENADSRRLNAESGEARAAYSAEENDGSENTGTAAVERMPAGESSGEASAARDEAIEQDGLSRAATGRTAESPRELSGDEATLVIPRSGMPAPLRGSLASLERQNERLEAEGLERIEDEADLAARIADKLLVPLPASSALVVNPALEENHRYCRPWTAKFLADLARAHEAAFHRPIEVSSAVRTVEYQRRLMRTNGNAAPAEGDLVSPHLTGATVDIAKKGLTRAEMAWLRKRLMGLEAEGKIDVEEEFRQACFHITVYKSYAPAGTTGPALPAKPVVDRIPRTLDWAIKAQGA